MLSRILRLVAVSAVIFSLQGCFGERTVEKHYFDSPDGRYTFELIRKFRPFGSLTTVVNVGLNTGNDEIDFARIFHALSAAEPVVYWSEPNTLMILMCRGRIKEIKSSHRVVKDDKQTTLYIQAVTAPRVKLNGRLVCDFDPVTGWFTEEGARLRRPEGASGWDIWTELESSGREP